MKWIKVTDQRPPYCVDILFTDGERVYIGWCLTHDPEEELSFYNMLDRDKWWVENYTIIAWAKWPLPPRLTKCHMCGSDIEITTGSENVAFGSQIKNKDLKSRGPGNLIKYEDSCLRCIEGKWFRVL
jgi:hypothetical protein